MNDPVVITTVICLTAAFLGAFWSMNRRPVSVDELKRLKLELSDARAACEAINLLREELSEMRHAHRRRMEDIEDQTAKNGKAIVNLHKGFEDAVAKVEATATSLSMKLSSRR